MPDDIDEILDMRDLPVSESLPSATSFRVYRCGDPHHLHIVLFDSYDDAFAQFCVGRDNIAKITRCGDLFFNGKREPLTLVKG